MRILTRGNEGSLNKDLQVAAVDEPGVGGANHLYHINYEYENGETHNMCNIMFQNGGIAEHGINGVSNEALLAIVIDRLEGFSNGPFPSRETSLAKTKCEEALMWLESRTKDRERRGVEGEHKV